MSSPLENFNSQHKERWNILSNIPAWEQNGVLFWIEGILIKEEEVVFETKRFYQSGILVKIQQDNRLMFWDDLEIGIDDWPTLKQNLRNYISSDDERFIIFLELIIKYLRDSVNNIYFNSRYTSSSDVLSMLEARLNNGSRWRVVRTANSPAGLIERVDSKITEVAKELNNKFIDDAWELAYKLKPDPEKAIESIQSAIESIASKAGLTKAETKVYGTLLGDVKVRKSKSYQSIAKNEFDLSNKLGKGKSQEQNPNDMFTDWFWMGMDLIQKTNPGHHKSEVTKDIEVSPDSAKQAVLIGTLICQLIDSKYISKVLKK